MTADMLHHHLDLTSANNLLTIHHHHQNSHDHHNHHHHHHRHSHERAASVTSDQFSSLNLSSVGPSSSASSAHHSPIMEHHCEEAGAGSAADQNNCQDKTKSTESTTTTNLTHLEGHFNRSLTLRNERHMDEDDHEEGLQERSSCARSHLGDSGSSSCCASSSDYAGSQASIPPMSPVSLELPSSSPPPTDSSGSSAGTSQNPSPIGGCELDLTSTSSVGSSSSLLLLKHHHHHDNHNHQQRQQQHLHPNYLQQRRDQNQDHQQKVRSFSHTTSYSPLSLDSSENENSNSKAQVSEIVERPRRLSRIENRQSLHDLGYGQIESYFKLQRLGKGTYATVYMGRSRVNNDLVALKEILKEHDEGAPCTAIREVSLLRLLRHNNIVTLHDICHTPKKLTLVFEYVGPDLYAYMKENNHLLSIHNVRLLLFQLLRGIAFCHSRQVLHRDLKPQNLLINTRGELKIYDFGLARAKSIPTKSYSNEVVTLWYRPPDVLLGNTDYDHSIDMWGVGCIFYEMASGRTFFPGSSVRQQLYLIFSSLGAPNFNNWPEILTNPEYLSYSFPSFRPEKLAHRVPRLDPAGVHLLQSFLRFKPSERLSAQEAMREPFFACLPPQIHKLPERESILDVPGVYMSLNPGQKFQNHHNQQYFHSR